MKIKGKILAGLLFLFGLSVLITGMAAYYNRKLANDSQAILKDNFNTVVYAKDMLKALSVSESDSGLTPILSFENSLRAQQHNITEEGEQQLTDSISAIFFQYKTNSHSELHRQQLNRLLYKVMELNLTAIDKKNSLAQTTAQNVFNYLLFAGIFFLVVAVVFIIRFPSYVAVPIIKRDADKTNLIATVSHELKTPAAAIKLSTKLLEDKRVGTLNEEQRQLIRSIKEDTERVLRITGEVLNMAQMESGKIHLNIHPAEPKQIVKYAIDATAFQAEQKEITVEVNYDEHLPTISADAEKTTWVMINLLSNAIRYSPEKEKIQVDVKLKNESVIFSVTDHGKGIDPIYKDRIFERYFRIPGNKQGTGLGLSISKEFIEAQGGKIYLENKSDQGCKLSFELRQHFINDIPL
jgi:signal transduction histidine kinase